MLGVTTYLSTDIAAIPLLWVLPLSLYLLSFVVTFARRPRRPLRGAARALPMAVLVLSFTTLFEVVPLAFALPLHLVTFFQAALVCHGQLADDRPPARHLTAFYLSLSLGGVLGGLFNAVVAPLVFDRVVEYPLALVLLCLLRPAADRLERGARQRWLDLGLPAALGALLAAALVLGLPALHGLSPELALTLLSAPAILICYSFKERPVRFALGIGVVLLVGGLSPASPERTLHRERSFFGVLRVLEDARGNHRLAHGNTLHGQQNFTSARGEPLTYYHRTGPIGHVLAAFQQRTGPRSIAVVGLGAGSLACYARGEEDWTFYEIDPAVERVARNPQYFTFLQDSRARKLNVVLGDARLRLQDAPEREYELIVLDAFSSDAIPVHLLTREAWTLYLGKLAPAGLLAVHISNRSLDLKPVLRELARDAQLVNRFWRDEDLSPQEQQMGKTPSEWVVMARQEGDLGELARDPRWGPLPEWPRVSVWRDDFSNILSVLPWTWSQRQTDTHTRRRELPTGPPRVGFGPPAPPRSGSSGP
jgi:spermidine synthase